ncbi:S66 peptidase family protein [Actinomadura terrae]|uniref:S66 peptidase family protein n=1 Tax=Actinomadura terrae TaxID=604353 RepID=UPI001FA7F8AF|nr:LD-carboxypeptidase [Actinomadura terrae]
MIGGARAEAADGSSGDSAAGLPGGRSNASDIRRYRGLRPGDRIAVVAPSGPADPARLEAGCAVLRDLGLDVVVGKHALDRVNLGAPGPLREDWHRLAGGDADRAADLEAAWCDPRVRAVVCARGGYGATRVLDHLDWDALAAATREAERTGSGPKILHGSSDITALHVAFGARLGITTSFGPMPAGRIADLTAASHLAAAPRPAAASRTADASRTGGAAQAGDAGRVPDVDAADVETFEGLRGALFREEQGPLVGTRALREGRAEGPLTGGTLALLVALLGTPYAPPPAAGRVVLLEDVSEAPYRIDRMLVQLLQAGWFDGAAGVVLGSWERSGDPEELDTVFAARLGPLGVPVLAGVPAGHGPRQRTLELGAPARLDAGALTLRAPGGAR